jgi:hypothetical protein
MDAVWRSSSSCPLGDLYGIFEAAGAENWMFLAVKASCVRILQRIVSRDEASQVNSAKAFCVAYLVTCKLQVRRACLAGW